VWQDLHDELSPLGVDVTTVALDTPASAAPWLDAIRDGGPLALIDEALLTVPAIGWVNVPSAIWFDESGVIVRGPEVAFVRPKRSMPVAADASDEQREAFGYIEAFPNDAEAWLGALRDWAARGTDSPFARSPAEVRQRSRPFGLDAARAAAHHALGEHLRALGDDEDARAHQRLAHELEPGQWNRKRHTWCLAGGPDQFDTSFLAEMRAHGPLSFYPPVDLG
jgi:hypothetical protein